MVFFFSSFCSSRAIHYGIGYILRHCTHSRFCERVNNMQEKKCWFERCKANRIRANIMRLYSSEIFFFCIARTHLANNNNDAHEKKKKNKNTHRNGIDQRWKRNCGRLYQRWQNILLFNELWSSLCVAFWPRCAHGIYVIWSFLGREIEWERERAFAATNNFIV